VNAVDLSANEVRFSYQAIFKYFFSAKQHKIRARVKKRYSCFDILPGSVETLLTAENICAHGDAAVCQITSTSCWHYDQCKLRT